MKNHKQWVNWDMIPGKNGRLTKIPVNPITGRKINPHDLKNQLTYNEALSRSDKVGFVITENDPFFLLDIDHALQVNGQWSPHAVTLSNKFAQCYQEVSFSNEALHVIGSISDHHPHKCTGLIDGQKIELYTKKRFVAITGKAVTGKAEFNSDAEFTELVQNYFPSSTMRESYSEEWTTTAAAGWHGPEDDEELIRRMLKSGSGATIFNDTRASIKDLWECKIDVLSVAFPHGELSFDASSADQSLLSHLAFWTGKNCARMERIFSMSALVREKWVERDDYRRRSIINACNLTQNCYGQGVSLQDAAAAGQVVQQQIIMGDLVAVTRSPGFQLMTPESQIEFFAGCVYICDENKIMIPNRRLLKRQQFEAYYGGWVFSMDAENDKTSKSAWDTFTLSQAVNFPKVDGRKFDPKNKTGLIISNDGTSHVNTYTVPHVPSVPGDVSKFTQHIGKMIPDSRDREILLSWCAAVVQYPGIKFGWAPLIQGTYGNGKSMIGECIAEAVGRQYAHAPEASEICEKYNDWLLDTIFQCIDEMYTGVDKFKTLEKLKNWVQHKTDIEIRAMNTGKIMYSICCNFLMLSNHKDAVVKTKEDRRIAVFYTAQQCIEDMHRDGFLDDYFSDFFTWLQGTGQYEGQTPGYHHITYFLQTYNISPEFNPAVSCGRAPITTSTNEAILESLSDSEELILNAISEEKPGFRGGYISSTQVINLFRINNRRVSIKHMVRMMDTLKYIYHPGLFEGRASSRNNFDKGRPKLYANQECIEKTKGWRVSAITADYLKQQGFNDGNVFGD